MQIITEDFCSLQGCEYDRPCILLGENVSEAFWIYMTGDKKTIWCYILKLY